MTNDRSKGKTRHPAKPSDETLFAAAARRGGGAGGGLGVPLADRVRPRSLEELVGQQHLVGEGKLLGRAIADDRIPSMILWGPPGSGKTTLAHIVAGAIGRGGARSHFVPFSAVLGGVPEIRAIVEEAKRARA